MPLFALIGFLVFLSALLLVAVAVSSRMQRATFQESFGRGQAPQPMLDGFYPGASHVLFGVPVPWLGKQFTLTPEGGTNIFSSVGGRLARLLTHRYKHFASLPDGTVSAYNFRTTVGAGLRDPNVHVLKLDYNIPENPGIIRIIYDELVQVDPGRYLGKVYLQVLPGWFLCVGFFELKARQKVNVEPAATPASVDPTPVAAEIPVVSPPVAPVQSADHTPSAAVTSSSTSVTPLASAPGASSGSVITPGGSSVVKP